MKKIHLFYIVYFLLSSLLPLNGSAQDFATQWHLPEGAKAHLGRGRLMNIKLSDDVHSVKFSQDGTQLISVSSDGSLHLWDVDTGRYQFSFSVGEHTHWVSTLAFSADGKTLASGSYDGTILLWDWETLK